MTMKESSAIDTTIAGAVLHNLVRRIMNEVGLEHAEPLEDDELADLLVSELRYYVESPERASSEKPVLARAW